MIRFFVAAAMGLAALKPAHAQFTGKAVGDMVIERDGWEAFPFVQYQGGVGSMSKKVTGVLVLTDSTIALHECAVSSCSDDKKKGVFKETALLVVQLKSIQEVSSSTQVRGPTVGARLAFGLLAGDRTEEYFGVAFETATTAEAPIFKTRKTQAAMIDAKIRFRLKKLGLELKDAK